VQHRTARRLKAESTVGDRLQIARPEIGG